LAVAVAVAVAVEPVAEREELLVKGRGLPPETAMEMGSAIGWAGLRRQEMRRADSFLLLA
jgi:hypothetical protein